MVPINVSPDRMQHLAATFQCQVGMMPFTYLGLPLGLTQPTLQDCLPLVTRVERRLVSTSIFLSQGGKLQMVNSVLSSLPTFYMCAIKIPCEVIKQIDKYRRHCLWRGSDINAKKPPLAAWKMVQKPKLKGGLGVLNIRIQNEALLLKNYHKFFNKADVPWVKMMWAKYYTNGRVPSHRKKGSFWWRRILNMLSSFKGIAHAKGGTGDTILFWHDLWNGTLLKLEYPKLYTFVIKSEITLQQVMETEELHSMFHLPLSEQAFAQYQELTVYNMPSQQQQGSIDQWTYIWGNGNFSSVQAYKYSSGFTQVHPIFKWLWKSSCQ